MNHGGGRAGWVIWSLTALIVALVIAAAWLEIGARQNDAEAVAIREAEQLTHQAEAVLNRSFVGLDLMLADLAQLPGMFQTGPAPGAAETAQRLLRTLADQHLLVSNLLVVTERGEPVVAADELPLRSGLQLPEGFLAGISAQSTPQLAVAPALMDVGAGEPILYVGRPQIGPGGRRLVALAAIPVSALSHLIRPGLVLDDLTMTVENEAGVLLASIPPNHPALGRSLGSRLDIAQSTGKGVLTRQRLSATPGYLAARPLVYRHLTVSAAIDGARVNAHAAAGMRLIGIIAAAFIVMVLVVAALAHHFVRGLTRANRIALQSRTALDEALASMHQGFLLCDANDHVMVWNERYVELFPHLRPVLAPGVEFRKLALAGARAVMPDAEAARLDDWIVERIARHREGVGAYEMRLANGQVIDAVTRVTASGRVVSVYREVTDERRAALELVHAKEAAEQASAAKGLFLATVSHEIRTPLNGLVGMLELLALSTLDAEQRETLTLARDSGHALGRIIDDILDHAKIEAGKLEILAEPVSLSLLVEGATNIYRTMASKKGLLLSAAADDRIAPAHLSDSLRLLQVLGNFISNSVKFTHSGAIEVRADFVARGEGTETVCLLVRDTGIGMSADALERAFRPFEQAGADISRMYGGTGLGLAISRRLIEMMGGTIAIESAPGQGTSIRATLTLPVVAAAEAAALPQIKLVPSTIAYDVLAVDDSPTNLILLKGQLGRLGMHAVTACDGREAFAIWCAARKSAPFALVVTDCNMPVMDGFALARAIRSEESGLPGGQCVILGWTAGGPNVADQCRDAGMNGMLNKPASIAQLRQEISRWLRLDGAPAGASTPGRLTEFLAGTGSDDEPAGATEAIDRRALADYAGGVPELMRQVAASFSETLSDRAPAMQDLLAADDLDQLGALAHMFKGSAATAGALRLASICGAIQDAARGANRARLPTLCAAFRREAARVQDELRLVCALTPPA